MIAFKAIKHSDAQKGILDVIVVKRQNDLIINTEQNFEEFTESISTCGDVT